eukprot:3155464-Rhodomonas_salina.2
MNQRQQQQQQRDEPTATTTATPRQTTTMSSSSSSSPPPPPSSSSSSPSFSRTTIYREVGDAAAVDAEDAGEVRVEVDEVDVRGVVQLLPLDVSAPRPSYG